MKQTAGNKKTGWLLPVVIAVVILAVIGAVLVSVSGGNSDQTESADNSKLYWNLDRERYSDPDTGLSVRESAEDGIYRIRFAVDGEQEELPVADKKLVNLIDSMDIMGLSFDGEGMVIDAIDVKQIATETAKAAFVQKVSDGEVILNSSIAMNGMEIPLTITQNTGIYNVCPLTGLDGQSDQCEFLDKVNVYSDDQGNVTHIFITERQPESDVYWRVKAMFDSEKGVTTRIPDENGVYSIDFAVNGQVVTLKCKDKELVTEIDGYARYNADMGLVFDEEGYIIDTIIASTAIRGIFECGTSEVIAVDGASFTTEGQLPGDSQGQTYKGTVGENCKIYNVNDAAESFGELTQLQVGDRIKGYANADGELILIFVMNRLVDSPMYYSLERYYLINGVTTRKPDANGYYVFQMAGAGRSFTAKTKDIVLASELDSFGYRCVGLHLNGDIIEAVYDPVCIAGYYSFGANMYITTLTHPVVGAQSGDGASSASGIMTDSCKIYNVTGIGAEVGKEDTLRLGDQIMGYTNARLEVVIIFIINRVVEGTDVYWNHTPMYDADLKTTTRTPDENDYYIFRVAVNGKDTTVRTKSHKLATQMDSYSPQMFALKVSGDIVQEVYPAIAATGGQSRSNWFKVKRITSEEIETYSLYGSGTTMLKPSSKLAVYNVSEVFDDRWGEKTTLKVGDQIHALTDRQGETVIIFVRSRDVDSPLYWNKTRKYNSVKEETTRVPDAKGFYVYELAVNGQVKIFKTDNKTIANQIDSYRIAFGLKLEGDIIKQVYPAKSVKGIKQSTASWLDVMSINGNTVYVQQNIPTASDLGTGYNIQLTSGCKVYDVSSYANPFGGEAKLKVGDRIHAFINDDDKVTVCYIVKANTRKNGPTGHCDHCDKEVLWEPWSGDAMGKSDCHYYLTNDISLSSQIVVGDTNGKYDIVLDLNGHTVESTHRAFLVWEGSRLSVMDSVGGGAVAAAGLAGNAGTVMVYSGGTFDLYSGTLTRTEDKQDVTNGGVVYLSGEKSVFNLHGGTIIGGEAKLGGNIYVQSGTFNMKGGTVCDGTSTSMGGNIYAGIEAVLNITGGTVCGGEAVDGLGNTIYQSAGAQVNLSGGKLDGEYYVASATKLVVSGAPQLTDLKVATGALLTLGELTDGADITVAATGVFTQENEKVQSYAEFFKPARAHDLIEVQQNVLVYTRVEKDRNTVDNADLVFEAGSADAVCPFCCEKVSWTSINGDQAITLGAGHYYLAEDITYTGTEVPFITAPGAGKEACLHLNGHNITATGHAALEGNASVLNIMGTGTVSGSRNQNLYGATVNMAAAYQDGAVHLIGGTYTKALTAKLSSVVTVRNGGDVNMYNGAQIVGVDDAGTTPNVRVYNRSFNMYGGKIAGGRNEQLVTGNWSDTATGIFIMYGGEIVGTVSINGAQSVYGGCGIAGGTITGTLRLNSYTDSAIIGGSINKVVFGAGTTSDNSSLTLSGAPLIGSLQVPAGYLVDLWEMAEGASVTVSANGVFTAPSENAADYKDYFIPAINGDKIEVENNALTYQLGERNVTDDLAFVQGTTLAACPVCGVNVQWTALTEDAAVTLEEGHYYLAADVTYAGTEAAFLTAPSGGKTACLHLNGHNITATGHAVLEGNASVVNIMGTGTVSGSRSQNLFGATINMAAAGQEGAVNLYSGTYTKSVDAKLSSIVAVRNGGDVNLYGGEIVGVDDGGTTPNVRVYNRSFNLHGGKISGGRNEQITVSNWSTTATGTLTISGGTVDGLVRLNNYTYSTLSGGSIGRVIIENSAANATSSVALSGAPVIGDLQIPAGYLLTLGELTADASVTVTANGVFTQPNDKASAFTQYIRPATGYVLTAENNVLRCERNLNVVDNGDLELSGNQAQCPVCAKTVTWTAISADQAVTLAAGHYYLAADITYTGTVAAFITAPGAGKEACLHLNGHDITATGHAVVEGNASVLNIMGTGTVSGSRNQNLYGATINMAAADQDGTINLIGGTYTKALTAKLSSVVTVRNGGDMNMYGGAQIVGVDDGGTTPNVRVYNRSFNMYGGSISGGKNEQIITSNWSTTATGVFTMHGGQVVGTVSINGAQNRYGGCTITGGTINGNLRLNIYTASTLSGGSIDSVIIGAGATKENSSLNLSGNPDIKNIQAPSGYLP